jgi:uncharacterized protein DUF5610
MAVSGIQPQPNPSIQTRAKEAEGQLIRRQLEQIGAGSVSSDRVSVSGIMDAAETQRILTERLVTRVEQQTPAAQELFQAAGKADFEAKIAQPGIDTSAEATAGRIVDGITGYIFGAFQLQNPDMTEADFTRFQEQVLSGFERGLEEAKDILSGLQALTPEIEDSVGQTESLVREQLSTFFEEMIATLREDTASANEA